MPPPAVAAETVTVTCHRHRRHCQLVSDGIKGRGIRIQHAGPRETDWCDSLQFTVRREYPAGREGAHAELLALALTAAARP
jgi:hypothetical protein